MPAAHPLRSPTVKGLRWRPLTPPKASCSFSVSAIASAILTLENDFFRMTFYEEGRGSVSPSADARRAPEGSLRAGGAGVRDSLTREIGSPSCTVRGRDAVWSHLTPFLETDVVHECSVIASCIVTELKLK